MEMFLQSPTVTGTGEKVYLRLARSQDINRYTFPENMAGYSHAIQ